VLSATGVAIAKGCYSQTKSHYSQIPGLRWLRFIGLVLGSGLRLGLMWNLQIWLQWPLAIVDGNQHNCGIKMNKQGAEANVISVKVGVAHNQWYDEFQKSKKLFFSTVNSHEKVLKVIYIL